MAEPYDRPGQPTYDSNHALIGLALLQAGLFLVPLIVLGKAIGETLGYALTATFTVLVVIALSRSILPRWLALTGYAAAVLIATGVVIPLVEAASLTNFAGYVAWCAWLLAVAFLLVRAPAD